MGASWPDHKSKKSLLWSVIFYSTQQQWTISQLDCDMRWKVDCILQPVMTSSAQWLEWEVPKHFPKPNLPPKKVMVTVWWSAAGLIHYSFLNAGKTIISEKYAQQMDERHWKFQHIGKQKGHSSSCQHPAVCCPISSLKV